MYRDRGHTGVLQWPLRVLCFYCDDQFSTHYVTIYSASHQPWITTILSPQKSRLDLISLFSEFASPSKNIVHKNINDVACNIILKITIDTEVRLRAHMFKFDATFISLLLLFCIIISSFPWQFSQWYCGTSPLVTVIYLAFFSIALESFWLVLHWN